VAHRFDDDIDYELRREPERRRWVGVAVVAALAMFGVTSAMLWRAYSAGVPVLPSFASGAAPGAASPAEVADKAVGFKEFQALQQQIAGSLQSSAQLVAAQQAEIKRLSDQVSALSAKIDALQRPAASAQAPVASPPPPPPPAARKKPAAAKLPPGISTGGAPLPLTER
jgi:cell division protein FtsB